MRVLIQHLPRDSAFVRAVHGEDAEWGLNEHLMAAVVDHLAIGNWLFTSAHLPEDESPPEQPRPVPRPGIEEDPVEEATPDDLARFFSGL
ncbi:hypothetical protein [Thermomonospora umbrina]|uniref:Uncharacterized protein n=1 Tax=Thermomonospora umbrina TaxID=111806 RepID=A0A3D9STY9_9ACTN|nr:hypothetical protein [Thermomonospora umbrina]REE95161.1 hypothetical protein DFJ69_0543 [Thermomonospora umbrina]